MAETPMISSSRLILGTVQLGLDYGINNPNGKPSEQTAFEILKAAEKAGIAYLDTAAGYGNSEEVIGNYIQRNGQNPFRIITKLATGSGMSWEDSLAKSLARLKVDCIDTLLFHSFQHYAENKDSLHDFEAAISDGKLKRIGVSVYTNEELFDLVKDPLVSVVQAPFNLLDNHSLRAEAFEALKASGKEVHTRSVFLQGLFFKSLETFPQVLSPLKQPIEELRALCTTHDLPMATLAMQYSMSKPYIDHVLFGVDSLEQLNANLSMLDTPMNRDILEQVDAMIRIENKDLLNPSFWNQ